MSKHTPGPWIVQNCPITGNVCGSDTWALLDPPDCPCGRLYRAGITAGAAHAWSLANHDSNTETENSCLRDVLAALKEIIAARDEHGLNDYPAITRARAAIAKAEGK